MQPRTLDQIISELNTTYNPQIETIRKQQALVPQQTEALIQQAGAAQTQAYEDILSGARRRGLGFSGIPLGEQAKYASTVYAPAVLQARAQGQQQALSLEEAINQLTAQRAAQAESIRQYETSLAENQRQFNEQMAQARRSSGGGGGGFSPSLGDIFGLMGAGGGGAGGGYQGPRFEKSGAGYNFFDATGSPITALQYAQQSGQGGNMKAFLQDLANKGDANAKIAVQFADSNFKNIPVQYKNAIQALGIGSASYVQPAGTYQSLGRTVTPQENPANYAFWNRGRR